MGTQPSAEMARALPAAGRVLDRVDPRLLAAEIHVRLLHVQTCIASAFNPHLYRSRGGGAHACVRTWSPTGWSMACVEDATGAAMSWALEKATLAALSAHGKPRAPVGIPVPIGDETASPALDALSAPEPELEFLAQMVARTARAQRLPVQDVRITWLQGGFATLSTTGVLTTEDHQGLSAAAYVSYRHPLEPADALTSAFHPRDGHAACRHLLQDLRALKSRFMQATGEPLTTVPSEIPILCAPRPTAQLLALLAAEHLSGRRDHLRADAPPKWSDRISIEERPRDQDSPRRRYFDDEGLTTKQLLLVKNGAQKGRLHTSETASAACQQPNGCAVRGASHIPTPGFRGLDLRPTQDASPDPDGSFLIDDIVVSQEAQAGGGTLLALGRLRTADGVRPVRMSRSGLLEHFAQGVSEVYSDGGWSMEGVRGRSVLVVPLDR